MAGSNDDAPVRVTWAEYDQDPEGIMEQAVNRRVLVDDQDGSTTMLLDCSPVRDEDLLEG